MLRICNILTCTPGSPPIHALVACDPDIATSRLKYASAVKSKRGLFNTHFPLSSILKKKGIFFGSHWGMIVMSEASMRENIRHFIIPYASMVLCLSKWSGVKLRMAATWQDITVHSASHYPISKWHMWTSTLSCKLETSTTNWRSQCST